MQELLHSARSMAASSSCLCREAHFQISSWLLLACACSSNNCQAMPLL